MILTNNNLKKNIVYYHISGHAGDYCIFVRNTENKFPFNSSLHNPRGSSRNATSWKTEAGLKRYIEKNCPTWVLETTEEFRSRKKEYQETKI